MFGQTTPLGWQGQSGAYFDTSSGLIKLGLRYYSPSLGRFISRDPIGFAGGLNLYGYCNGDPVNGCDASGLDEENQAQAAVGFVLSIPQRAVQGAFHYGLAAANAGM